MKLILSLLVVFGLLIIAYSQIGAASHYALLSDSYPVFESLGETNPLRDKEFNRKYTEYMIARKQIWNPVFYLGVCVLITSCAGFIIVTKRLKKSEPVGSPKPLSAAG